MSKQKITYQEMISKLQNQTFEAPNNWSTIESDLDLHKKASEMKSYSAPDDLWDKIDAELNTELNVDQQPSSKKVNKGKYALIALILISIITSVLWFSFKKDASISYSSEIEIATNMTENIEVTNSDQDQSIAFEFIKENDFLYSAKDKVDYEKQLEELQQSKKDILMMQEQYGVDKNTQKMLAKVERQIAELLKSMITSA